MGARILNNGGQILASLSNFLVLCRCQAQAQPVITGLGMAGSLQTQQHHKITTRNLVRVRPSTCVTFLTSDSAQGLQHFSVRNRDQRYGHKSVLSLCHCFPAAVQRVFATPRVLVQKHWPRGPEAFQLYLRLQHVLFLATE